MPTQQKYQQYPPQSQVQTGGLGRGIAPVPGRYQEDSYSDRGRGGFDHDRKPDNNRFDNRGRGAGNFNRDDNRGTLNNRGFDNRGNAPMTTVRRRLSPDRSNVTPRRRSPNRDFGRNKRRSKSPRRSRSPKRRSKSKSPSRDSHRHRERTPEDRDRKYSVYVLFTFF